jgi:hypothetical protein
VSGSASRWTAFRRWVPWLALTNAMFWAALWIAHAADGAQRDWSHFHDTARLVLAGRVNEIYPGHTHGLPFLHPPYFALALVPFGLLSRTAGYFACILSTVLALAGALWLLRRTLQRSAPRSSPGDRSRFAVGALIVVGSASWNVMMALGQVSAWYLLILCATLSLWMRGERAWAGAVVALMMLKPNLGAVFPLIFLARGQWRVLVGWCAGSLVLLLATLPFGLEVWAHYLTFMRSSSGLIDKIPVWRQHTMRAFWHSFVDAPALLLALWVASALPLVAATGWAWLETALVAKNLPRLFGVTILLLVTCNPYLHHYDTLILAVPGLVWYLDRDSYSSPLLHRVCGGCLLVAYLVQMVSVWLVQGGWSLVGPPLAVWLLADAFDLARRPAGRPSAAPAMR